MEVPFDTAEYNAPLHLNPIYSQLADLSNRITALEMAQDKARATAPVSDDEELVEALAKIDAAYTFPDRAWPDGAVSPEAWRRGARKMLDSLRADGFDVVKRS